MSDIDISGILPFVVNGEDGISVTSARIGSDGHLRLTLSNDTSVDAGNVADGVDAGAISTANAYTDTAVANLAAAAASTFVTLPQTSDVSVVYVTANGNDSNDGLSPHSAKATLSAAATTINALNGGVVQLGYCPSGIALTGTVTFTKPTILQGMGRTASVITDARTVGDGIVFGASNSVARDFSLTRSTAVASQTGGAGIVNSVGHNSQFVNLSLSGWYDNFRNDDGFGYHLDSCYIINPVRYGVYNQSIAVPDRGDSQITSCTFDSVLASPYGAAALRIDSGGGLKITGNKFVDWLRHIDLQMVDGSSTSVMTITGNSFEVPASGGCIRMGRSGTTGTFGKFTISGNQFNVTNATTAQDIISIDTGISAGVITGNYFEGNTTNVTGVHLRGSCDNMLVGDNSFLSCLVAIVQDANCDVQIGNNKFRNCTTVMTSAQTYNTSPLNVIEHAYRCDVGSITSSVTYKNLYRIDVKTFSGVKLDLYLTGLVNAVGAAATSLSRNLTRATTTVSSATINTDATSTAIDIQFDTATTSGSVIIGVRLNAAGGGTSFTGCLQIKLQGGVTGVAQLVP